MTGYDFDKTIYGSDSSTDFFKFMLIRKLYLLLCLPYFVCILFLYAIRLVNKKRVKELLFFYVPHQKNLEKIVNEFWDKKINKIYSWYLSQQKDDDVIISASLEFLIEPAMKRLGIKYYSATKYNKVTGKIEGHNCYGEEKVERFHQMFGDMKLDAFYSDSLSDKPMMLISDNAYLVKNSKPNLINVK